ncbi:MAG TPA: chain length-determining protein, partial [Burkholderiaceae bacterium]
APTGPNRPALLGGVLAAALIMGVLVATLMSKIRPTFFTQSSLRAATGLPVLGSVGLYWTGPEQQRQRKQMMLFTAAVVLLLIAFAGAMTPVILLPKF